VKLLEHQGITTAERDILKGILKGYIYKWFLNMQAEIKKDKKLSTINKKCLKISTIRKIQNNQNNYKLKTI
jgi:hypothetical protein